MSVSAFIRDGATRKAFIAEIEELHPSCKITYRPMQAVELAAFLEHVSNSGEEDTRRQSAKELAARLRTWDLKEDGNPALITEANLLVLQPRLYKRIQDIVFGYDPGDREKRAAELGN